MWSAATDVGEWLRGLDLVRYETVFREHAIDIDVLVDLTDGELAEIGVPLGERKRLLKAIASLSKVEPSPSAKEGAAPTEANMPATPTPALLAAGRDAERRPITVMFCDLVGSTTISAALRQDRRNLVSAYLDAASEAVTQMGGRVAKKLGDTPDRAGERLRTRGSGRLGVGARVRPHACARHAEGSGRARRGVGTDRRGLPETLNRQERIMRTCGIIICGVSALTSLARALGPPSPAHAGDVPGYFKEIVGVETATPTEVGVKR